MSVCLTTACGTGGWVGPLPGDPDNVVTLTAVPAFGGIDIRYVGPGLNPHAVSFAILWRGTSPDFNLAVEIDRFSGSHYYDKVDSSTTYYYWIQLVSIHGTVNGVVGPVSATARPLINDLLAQLTGKINSGLLATELGTKLSEIDTLQLGLTQEITDRQTGETTLAQAITNAQAGANQALTFISQEIADRASADQALATQIDTVAVALDGDIAAVQTAMNAEVTRLDGDITALGSSFSTTVQTLSNDIAAVEGDVAALDLELDGTQAAVATVQTNLNTEILRVDGDIATVQGNLTNSVQALDGDIAAVQNSMTAEVNRIDGELTNIGARWTVNLTANNLVGGFGVYNDGTTIEAGFDVDTFWVGKSGTDKVKPFVIDQGEVFINQAVINQLTADKIDTRGLAIKDANGNVVFSAAGGLDWGMVKGTNKPADGATRNVFKGVWEAGGNYSEGDIVFLYGSSWSCVFAHYSDNNNAPPSSGINNAWWTQYAAKGETGATGPAGPAGSNGSDGMDGAPGPRGSVTVYLSGYTAWNDVAANNYFTANYGGVKMLNDVVTQYGSGFSQTRFWNGEAWAQVTVAIDGNLLVAGTVGADKVSVTSLQALSAVLGDVYSGSLRGGAYTGGYSWPAAGAGGGFYIGPEGLLLGNPNTAGLGYFQVTAGGDIYAPNFSIVKGVMSISQLNLINTSNLVANSVTSSNYSRRTDTRFDGEYSSPAYDPGTDSGW